MGKFVKNRNTCSRDVFRANNARHFFSRPLAPEIEGENQKKNNVAVNKN